MKNALASPDRRRGDPRTLPQSERRASDWQTADDHNPASDHDGSIPIRKLAAPGCFILDPRSAMLHKTPEDAPGAPPSPLPDAREPLRGVSSDPGKRFPGSRSVRRSAPIRSRSGQRSRPDQRAESAFEASDPGRSGSDARSPIRSDPLHAALYPCSSDVSGSWLLRPPVSDAPGTRSRPIRVPDPGRMHPLPRPPPGARAPGRGSQGGAALSETDPRPPPDAMQNWPQRNEPPPFVVARETVRRRRLRACTPEATAQGVYGLAPWILPPLAHLG